MNRAPEQHTRTTDLKDAPRPVGAIHPVLASRYLVKGWIDRGALSVLYGGEHRGGNLPRPGPGASRRRRARVARERVADPAGPLVYVAAEGGRGIRNRLAAVGVKDPELIEAAEFFLLPVTLDLSQPREPEALVAALADVQPPLIVIDTLARSMGTGDENSAQDMGRVIRAIDQIRTKTGAHVMLIHHVGKDSTKGARGSSSLRGAVDTEIELTRSEGVMTSEPK